MQRLDVADVPAEHPLLQGLRPEHVVRNQQEPPALTAQPFVLAEYGIEVGAGPRCLVATQEGVQHGHEVRLTGTERTVQIRGLRGVPVECGLDQTERLVEVLQQPLGDDVVPQREGRALFADRLGELQNEVGGGDRRLDVDDVAEERGLGHIRGHEVCCFRSIPSFPRTCMVRGTGQGRCSVGSPHRWVLPLSGHRSCRTLGRVTGTTVRRPSSPLKSSGLVVNNGSSSATATAAIIRSAMRRLGLRPTPITAAQTLP